MAFYLIGVSMSIGFNQILSLLISPSDTFAVSDGSLADHDMGSPSGYRASPGPYQELQAQNGN